MILGKKNNGLFDAESRILCTLWCGVEKIMCYLVGEKIGCCLVQSWENNVLFGTELRKLCAHWCWENNVLFGAELEK